MIELQGVKKVYKSKRRHSCVALNGVSFTLPDEGMVFVLGKSGSGKSTLLNLLGGLDNLTEGKILVDGNDLTALDAAGSDAYRSTYAGFVFQDFCLIDGLTVSENVRLALDLLGKCDEGEVQRCLEDVDLADYADRYPRELSGGQCQRVAIARALIKSPRLILADEPTGNLDSKTARHVLDVLKELSKERLVVIVTHNADDAAQYGDRIIELSDGEIVRDVERSREAPAPLIGEDVITLPLEGALSDAELDAINARVALGSVRIAQEKEPFSETKQPEAGRRAIPIERPAKMRMRASLKLTATLTRGGYFGAAVTSLMLTVLALLLCFSLAFSFFDSKPLLREAISRTDDKSFAMHKGYYSDDPRDTSLKFDSTVAVGEADVNAFFEAGYEGNAYLLYNNPIGFRQAGGRVPIDTGNMAETLLEHHSPYARYGNGVLETDVAFLSKLYGTDGELTLLAGEIGEDANNKGILLSDYAADCILFYNNKLGLGKENPYQAIVDKQGIVRMNVSGVFETGYKERYAALFTQYQTIYALKNGDEREKAVDEIVNSELFAAFANEVDKYLAVGYYLGENFHERVIGGTELTAAQRLHNTDIHGNGKLLLEDAGWMYALVPSLEKGTALLGVDAFNRLFGTRYTLEHQEGFSPVTVTLVGYASHAGESAEPLYTHTVTIVGFAEEKDDGFRFSTEDFKVIRGHDHYPYAIYFDNAESAASVYDTSESLGFYTNNQYFKSVYTVKEIVEIFRDVFVYIGAAIALVALLFIVGFSLRTLRRRREDIGILRALGGRTSQIACAFVVQVALLGVVATVASAIALPLITGSVNTLLAENLANFLGNAAIGTLDVINLSPFVLPIVFGTFIPVLVLSSAVPFLFVRKLKPMSIIRSSDQ